MSMGLRMDSCSSHEYESAYTLMLVLMLQFWLRTGAMRLYSSSSYPCFNNPLRTQKNPHPFAMTTYYLSEGIAHAHEHKYE